MITMKHSNLCILVLLSLLLFSCDSNDLEAEEAIVFQFEATVIGQGLDCGDVYLVDLKNNTGDPAITDGRYYANHLSLDYKLNGL